jgi:hypothetical protein
MEPFRRRMYYESYAGTCKFAYHQHTRPDAEKYLRKNSVARFAGAGWWPLDRIPVQSSGQTVLTLPGSIQEALLLQVAESCSGTSVGLCLSGLERAFVKVQLLHMNDREFYKGCTAMLILSKNAEIN